MYYSQPALDAYLQFLHGFSQLMILPGQFFSEAHVITLMRHDVLPLGLYLHLVVTEILAQLITL